MILFCTSKFNLIAHPVVSTTDRSKAVVLVLVVLCVVLWLLNVGLFVIFSRAYWIRIFANYTDASKSYLTQPSPSCGKIKIENFHVFDMHWLYMTPRYVIFKADVTEHNDVNKHYGIVITIWRTSAIEVIALSKPHF